MQIPLTAIEIGKLVAPLAAVGYALRRRPAWDDVKEYVSIWRFRIREQTALILHDEPREMPSRALPRWIQKSKSFSAGFFRCYYEWAQRHWIDEAALWFLVGVVLFQWVVIYCLLQAFFIPVLADSVRYYALQLWWAKVALTRASVAGQDPALFLVVVACAWQRSKLIQQGKKAKMESAHASK